MDRLGGSDAGNQQDSSPPAVDGHLLASEHRVDGVLSHEIPGVWREVWPILRDLVTKEGITETDAFTSLMLHQTQLWCAWRGEKIVAAIVTRLVEDWPVCFVAYAAGTDAEHWVQPYWNLVKAWAKAHNRKCIVIAGRRGWKRLLGLRDGGTIPDGRPLMFYNLVDV